MRFNARKCYTLSITNRSSHIYSLDNHIPQLVSENMYLGVTLSDNLKWRPPIQKRFQKSKFYNDIPRTKPEKCPEQCKKAAYISLVRSILDYNAIIWDPYYIH